MSKKEVIRRKIEYNLDGSQRHYFAIRNTQKNSCSAFSTILNMICVGEKTMRFICGFYFTFSLECYLANFWEWKKSYCNIFVSWMLLVFFCFFFCCCCWNTHKSVHIFSPYLIVHNSAFDFLAQST